VAPGECAVALFVLSFHTLSRRTICLERKCQKRPNQCQKRPKHSRRTICIERTQHLSMYSTQAQNIYTTQIRIYIQHTKAHYIYTTQSRICIPKKNSTTYTQHHVGGHGGHSRKKRHYKKNTQHNISTTHVAISTWRTIKKTPLKKKMPLHKKTRG
jgi:hypothetical protein